MSSEEDRSHQRLGRCGSYELLVELASGGMATVYLARKAASRGAPLVAVKRPHRHLANDKGFLTMLVDEARLASSIHHDNVVKVRELAFDSGEAFIVMDYVEGASLADVRKELSAMGRALDPRFAVRIALDALAGLHAAHVLHDEQGRHLGIIHRDVSPHNVLLGCDGLARLTDFGIAQASDRVQTTRTHEVKGKLAYLAPERIDKRRSCTVQSDVFSMAVVLWECIAGRRLFRGDEAIDTLQEVVSAPIPSLRKIGAGVSEALDEAILVGLSRDLETRYKTAADFAATLAEVSGRENVAAPAEIASLVEALFGERLRVRHEAIRAALDGDEVSHVLEVSGLNERPLPTEEERERERLRLESIAPPAPSARYTFGSPLAPRAPRSFVPPVVRKIALAGAAALAVGALGFSLARGREPRVVTTAPPEPTIRRVIVPLPFTASRVTFDEQSRELSPPADVAAFEVPRESGERHRVTAIATDGARAEGFVVESGGVAQAEGSGFEIESFETYADEASTEESAPRTKRRGVPARPPRGAKAGKPPPAPPLLPRTTAAPSASYTVKDGFTKLR